MWPVSGSPSRKTAVTSAAEFAGNGFHTSLPSHCLTASGSLPPFTWLGEKRPSRKSVDWHTQHVAKPAQPVQCDQFIYRGAIKAYIPFARMHSLHRLCCRRPAELLFEVFGPSLQSTFLRLASLDNGLPGARSRSLTPIHFPPGGPPAQSMPNEYQMKENIPISPGPGSTGMWLTGHPPSHAMGGNTARPYDSQAYRPGLPSSCPGYQTSVNSGRPSTGASAGVPGGPGTHRDPNSLTASGRLDSGSHQLSQSMQRPQSSALDTQAPVSHSVLWEGEVNVNDPNFSGPSRRKMSLILEQAGLRDFSQLNMQLWGPVAQLSIVLTHCDSALVHRLTNNSPGGNLLAQVLVELPQSEEACTLVSALSSISSMAVPLGILSPPPNMLPNPIPPGTIGFVCLSYILKRNHIYGLIPADSEQFRQNLPSRQKVHSNLSIEVDIVPGSTGKPEVDKLASRLANASVAHGDASKTLLKVPKGTRDRNPFQMRVLEDVFSTIIQSFKRHDAVTIDTPVFELKDCGDTAVTSVRRDNKHLPDPWQFEEQLLAQRPTFDMCFPRPFELPISPEQVVQWSNNRVELLDKPAVDFDIAGEYGPMLADVECLRIVYEVLSELALGEFVIKVNHRRLLDGLFRACDVPAEKFNATCSAVDKLDKTPWSEVERELCEEKGLPKATVDKIGGYVQLTGGTDLIDRLEADTCLMEQESARNALVDIRLLLSYCESLGIADRVRFDLSLARGLDYYTGVIYEAVLTGFTYDPKAPSAKETIPTATMTTTSDPSSKKQKKKKKSKHEPDAMNDTDTPIPGEPLAVGSVAGGGRYDGLVGMFDLSGTPVPCVGVSFGVERLLAISEALATAGSQATKNKCVRPTETEVMVAGAHKGLILQRLECCRRLWDAKIKTTMSHKSNPKLLDQLQYCESTGIPFAVILGDGELQRGVVKLRVVSTRAEREVPYDDLVSELRKELALWRGQ
ncbi:hypothetical protein T265_04925 [Opisthorchis viverrini]|uniref:histidine--tRNA ligase n=1 Tax=Opisthorchis viverrini TaxID=6198 RepID=A0A075AFX8_OPIVI|nr:hypothetical protein T265_04925 [Opisthorchis viverrini]KER28164.1 hypothetical protein T265_04925 [Opisthorchis viverrini]